MKKITLFVLVIFVVVSAVASVSFTFTNTGWSAFYSQKCGNIFLMEIMGTSGFGVAAGYAMSFPMREKLGPLNVLVGKNTYTFALGMNLTQNVPAAYFQYQRLHTIAPFIYNFKFTAGNYGLPNFGISADARLYVTLLDFSAYIKEHSKLIFQTYMENFGLVSASLKEWRTSLMFTDEVGPLLIPTFGWSTKFGTFSGGIGYNGGLGVALGISSSKFSSNGGWWFRVMNSSKGIAVLGELISSNMELTVGYNRGAVYVAFER